MVRFRYLQLFCLSFLLLCFCGCPSSDSNIGRVQGVVTLDGTPVANAKVRFYPVGGRPSSGTTDENGRYDLRYTRSADGAVVGQHKVTISTKVVADNYDPENTIKAKAEAIPKKYLDRKKTELTATVESGSNTIDFPLTSGK